MNRYHIETLTNGAIHVFDRRSGLSGLWNSSGMPMHGDLTYHTPSDLAALLELKVY